MTSANDPKNQNSNTARDLGQIGQETKTRESIWNKTYLTKYFDQKNDIRLTTAISYDNAKETAKQIYDIDIRKEGFSLCINLNKKEIENLIRGLKEIIEKSEENSEWYETTLNGKWEK